MFYCTPIFILRYVFPLFAFFFVCCSFLRAEENKAEKPTTLSSPLYVYITIDDGPLTETQEIINVITELKLPVSFMMVGEHVFASDLHKKSLKLSESNPLICVGNHSYTHAHGHYRDFYSDAPKVVADFEKNEKALDLTNKMARLPGRNIWNIGGRKKHDVISGVNAAEMLSQKGYKVFGWDLEWHHNSKTGEPIESVDALVHEIVVDAPHAFTPHHVVVLAHDEMFHNAHQEGLLKQLLEKLKKEGVIFKTLADYPISLPTNNK